MEKEELQVQISFIDLLDEYIKLTECNTSQEHILLSDGSQAPIHVPKKLHNNSDEEEKRILQLCEEELTRIDSIYINTLSSLASRLNDVSTRADLEGSQDLELQPIITERDISDQSEKLILIFKEAFTLQEHCIRTENMVNSMISKLKDKVQAVPYSELLTSFKNKSFITRRDLVELMDEVSFKYAQMTNKVLQWPIPSSDQSENIWVWKKRWIFVAMVITGVMFATPIIGPANDSANKCLAMISGVVVLWITEALPFYVTAMLIPVLTVLFRIYKQSAHDAAEIVFQHMFNHTTALVLGGFSLSSAFSKYGFEKRLIGVLQAWLGNYPRVFLLSLMVTAWFLSMWISNVAAPVLCLSVVMPLLHTLHTDSPYAKATLIGLALACNIGGMLSPISSPQNAITIGALAKEGIEVSFITWLCVSVPFCFLLLLLAWIYVIVLLRPCDLKVIPALHYTPRPMGIFEWIVVATSLITALLWCSLAFTQPVFGDMGIIAFFPLLVFLSTGILNRNDFLGFGWNLIMLIMGGNVLGAAVAESRLLDIMGKACVSHLKNMTPWGAYSAILSMCLLVTTPLSHTVGAIVLSPMIVNIGKDLGNPEVLSVGAAFIFSAAMALPMSSFPNINSLLAEDTTGKPYLHAMDFILYATPFSLLVLGLTLTLGYALMMAVL